MKSKKIIFTLYEVSVLLLMLSSMNAYFLWGIPSYLLFPFSIFLGLFIGGSGINTKIKPIHLVCVLPLLLLAFLKFNLIYFITQLFVLVTIIQILSLPYELRTHILLFCSKALSIIVGISLVFWVIHLFFIEIPTISLLSYDDYYYFENHLFFLRLTNVTGYYRFTSVFLEPGHLAMFSAFFLYALQFNFKKWYVWVLILTVLFSLSLAGYILLVIGFVVLSINAKKTLVLKSVFLFATLLLSGYVLVRHYMGEDNIVYKTIILRLEADDEKGIVGNNRTNDYTNANFDNFLGSNNIWLGYSLDEYKKNENAGNLGGAGYKIYLFRNGIIGVFACFFFYFYLAYKSDNRRYMMLFLILFAIAFLQRAYPFWIAWLLPFLCTIQPQKRKSSIIKLNRV